MEVRRHLGFGFVEIVYKDVLQIEASLNEIYIEREKEFEVLY